MKFTGNFNVTNSLNKKDKSVYCRENRISNFDRLNKLLSRQLSFLITPGFLKSNSSLLQILTFFQNCHAAYRKNTIICSYIVWLPVKFLATNNRRKFSLKFWILSWWNGFFVLSYYINCLFWLLLDHGNTKEFHKRKKLDFNDDRLNWSGVKKIV